jgi:hypothetical protein
MGCMMEQSPVRIEAVLILCVVYLNQVHDAESFLTSDLSHGSRNSSHFMEAGSSLHSSLDPETVCDFPSMIYCN